MFCRTPLVLLRTGSLLLSQRFVPPWERDGRTAEEFFSGVMQSSNPVQQLRKREKRRQEAEEAAFAECSATPEDERRLEEMLAHNAAVEENRRNFLPYGAVPKRFFESTNMAAWGEYAAALKGMPLHPSATSEGGYSAVTQEALARDMEEKIPYRYNQYVEPKSGAQRPQWPLHGSVGVVMDIDGVVYRSRQLISGADTAIQTLQNLRIPFLFMTNGGGKSDAEKAEELSQLLHCTIDPSQVLLSHSPMRLLSQTYRDRPVLTVGPAHCAKVARQYGFRRAMSIQQFQCEHPEMVPFKKFGDLRTAPPGTVPFPEIAAILQMGDPEGGLDDIQVILDCLLAPHGRVGPSVSGTQTIPYYVAADDLLWATEAPLPRLGQGAFREMMASVFESVTGNGLQTTMYGKPRAIAYAFAEQRMRQVAAKEGWDPNHMRSIFMIGDNLETDIVGANARGGLWTSVHVLSGIGAAPAARRTLGEGDEEMEWLETCASKLPHYVAPTMDHFIRELLAFPESAVLQNKTKYFGKPNPADLRGVYNFH